MINIKSLLMDKALIIYSLSIINMVVWVKTLEGSFLLNSLIVVSLFVLASTIVTGRFDFDQAKSVLFYFWLINIVFFVFGGLFGSLGILLASIFLMARIVHRALTSDFYKSSVDGIVKDIRSKRRIKKDGKESKS